MPVPQHIRHFISDRIASDLESGKTSKLITRFPPEPSGYLHIGHAKAICLNFSLAQYFNGLCYLRFDDTNPTKEKTDYVKSIQRDINWLGFQWQQSPKFTSDYFATYYDWAITLIEKGLAYVCELDREQMREYRGTLSQVGKHSPFRNRNIAENLEKFQQMKTGAFAEGGAVLRAKIDMEHPNINMRDPVLYRIQNKTHHRTGDQWCIYPSYDFAHGQADAIEGVTHSLCTLEFSNHQPLYKWFLQHLPLPSRPEQIEFARLQLTHIVTSKRWINRMIEQGVVEDWDDPRLYTLAALRRRGYPAQAIVSFCQQIGITRKNSTIDIVQFESSVRDHLNNCAPRAMCVLQPLRVVLTNYRQVNAVSSVQAVSNPQQENIETREIPFANEIFIEQNDFREDANKKFKRLVLGKRVRLRAAYVIEAESIEQDSSKATTTVFAKIVPNSLGTNPSDGIKPKGVIHWVSAKKCLRADVALYNPLFLQQPDLEVDLMPQVNIDSLQWRRNAALEISLADAQIGTTYQFERLGYFTRDSKTPNIVFNRTIELRDQWQK